MVSDDVSKPEISSVTIETLKGFAELWSQASEVQQNFLKAKLSCGDDHKACKVLDIADSNPRNWRKRHPYFSLLEQKFREVPVEAATVFMGENLPLSFVVQNQVLKGSTNEQNKLKAAKDTQDVAVKLAFLKEAQKVHDKISISTKKSYD